VDIAVIGATHRKLRDMIEAGSFREDLYYRLNGLVVKLPALRERCDLDVVARRILINDCPHGTPEISASVMALFKAYSWPGNVRQLANVLRTAAVMAAGESQIEEHHLSDDFLDDVRSGRPVQAPQLSVAMRVAPPAADPAPMRSPELPDERAPESGLEPAPLQAAAEPAAPRTLGEAEVELIRSTLAAANGNISVASKRLGISRNTIYRKLRWGK
jgi:transcriptional regulator of acetoin/glycerol metabolism